MITGTNLGMDRLQDSRLPALVLSRIIFNEVNEQGWTAIRQEAARERRVFAFEAASALDEEYKRILGGRCKWEETK